MVRGLFPYGAICGAIASSALLAATLGGGLLFGCSPGAGEGPENGFGGDSGARNDDSTAGASKIGRADDGTGGAAGGGAAGRAGDKDGPPRGGAGNLAGNAGGAVGSGGGWISVTDIDGGGPAPVDAMVVDGAGSYQGDAATSSVLKDLCPNPIPTGCLSEVDEGLAALCNGLDDDCDGSVDEGCPCTPGAVQPCFLGPPSRRHQGACQDGTQSCVRGSGEFGAAWSHCVGGIAPSAETCDGTDNDCNGCTDEIQDCVPVGKCPGANDPRVPVGKPFVDYLLRGGDFYPQTARSWSWRIEGGPCDGIQPSGQTSFTLTGATSQNATFVPKLSGDYTVTMTVVTSSGETFSCTWIVHIRGPGLRIEMCYPESMSQDLDLYLKQPGRKTPWYTQDTPFSPSDDQCDWHNCEATLRSSTTTSGIGDRANWNYANSSLDECSGGPQGSQWAALGYCANPRLDIDNNLQEGSGLPENINVDMPREGDTFRIMVQNFSRTIAHPIVNVYCGGRRTATYGASPDQLTNFDGTSSSGVGAMWRVADVTTHLDKSSGETTCEVVPLHPAGSSGYWVTLDDVAY